MEYKGLTELNKDIPQRGKYTKMSLQAINDFMSENVKTAKLDIDYTSEQELKALYNALKSLIRRKNLALRASIHKDKVTNKKEIYLIQQNP